MENHSPSASLNAILFDNGKRFHLRGVQEHEHLTFGQLVRYRDPDRYIYYEHGSKNYNGRVSDDSDGKIVTILVSIPILIHMSLYYIFSKVPQHIIKPDAPFYLKPLPFTPTGTGPWFWEDLLSKTKLQIVVKGMFKDAHIEGRFTNHSLRASGTTALFDTSIQEAVIQSVLGTSPSVHCVITST